MRDTSLFDNRFNTVKNVKSFQFVNYDTISKKFTIDFISRQGSRQDLTNCFKNTQENAKGQEQPRHSRNDKWTSTNKYQDITKLQYLHLRHCGLGTKCMDIDTFTSYLPMEEKKSKKRDLWWNVSAES